MLELLGIGERYMKQLICYRKRTALRIFITMFLIISIAGAVFFSTEFEQMGRMVTTMNAPQVETINDFDTAILDKGKAKVNVNYIDDTGLSYGTDSETQYSYTYTQIDGYFVIVLQDGGEKDLRLIDLPEGSTESVTFTAVKQGFHGEAIDRYAESVADYYELTQDEALQYFYPEVVRLEGYRSNLNLPLFLIGGGLVATILLYAFLSYKALNDITKNLDSYEMDRIDAESQHPIFKAKSVVLTKNYLIRTSGLKLSDQLIPLNTIAWVYRKTTTQRVYGIPAGKTHVIVLYRTTTKKVIEIPISEIDFERFIDVFDTMNLDAAIGYHDLFIALWSTCKDGELFLSKVRELRDQTHDDVVDVEVNETQDDSAQEDEKPEDN